jgi:hypothetical protein
MKKYSHYILPAIISLLVSIIGYIKIDYILEKIKSSNLDASFLTTSITLFGLVLTSYGIFFALTPLLKKEIQVSKTLIAVNKYFFVCLLFLLILIILNILLLFIGGNYILIGNIFIFTYILSMFFYIIRGLRSIFKIINSS